MNILITGSAGFIGKNLIRKLAEDTSNVLYGIDIANPGMQPASYTHINADMGSLDYTARLPKNTEIVIHLAQSLRYREFPEGVEDTVRINIEATSRLLEWSRENKIKRFIFASTGNVYKQSKKILRETSPCEADSIYAATKLSAEHIVKQYGSIFQIVVMRIFGVYGPGQEGTVIPSLINNIKTGKEITIPEDGGLRLTPIFITDCVEMINRLLNYGMKKNYDVFNICGKEVLSLGRMVEIISSSLGETPKIKKETTRSRYFQGSNAKIIKEIGYQPSIDFAEGISKIIQSEAKNEYKTA